MDSKLALKAREDATPDLDEGDSDGKEDLNKRGHWSSRLDYLLSMVGYCVGFGNLWRFPYVCNRNGGGAFLIPFVLFLFVAAMPMFFLEAALSQFSGKGPFHVWSFCPLFKGIGVCNIMQIFFYYPYYAILIAWPTYYMFKTFTSTLPWTTCSNWWNTELCVEDTHLDVTVNGTYGNSSYANETTLTSMQRIAMWKNETFAHSSLEEFWQYNVQGLSSGLGDLGGMQWHLVGCLFFTYVLIFLALIKGVKSVGKVVYVTALLPYVLLLIIFIKTLTLPGALDGVLYYVKPDFSQLLRSQVWLEGCLQVFYSLGVGFGMIATANSYNRFHSPCLRDSIIVCFISEGTSMFAGFVTFAVLGVMSDNVGIPISEVVSSGPGLAFVTYPDALSKLPIPQLWSFLLFLMLLMVGLDSQFMSTEILTTALVDQFPKQLKKKRALVTLFVTFAGFLFGIIYCTQLVCTEILITALVDQFPAHLRRRWVTLGVCLGAFLLGLLFCTKGGPYLLQFMDWYVCSLAFFVVCIMECVCVAWIYGIGQFSRDVEMMLGRPPPMFFKIIWCYVSPVLLPVIFVATLVGYQPPSYGKYKYPEYTGALGWCLASIPLIPIPVFMVLELRKHSQAKSFKERVLLSLKPESDWRPRAPEYREEHLLMLKTPTSLARRFRDTVASES